MSFFPAIARSFLERLTAPHARVKRNYAMPPAPSIRPVIAWAILCVHMLAGCVVREQIVDDTAAEKRTGKILVSLAGQGHDYEPEWTALAAPTYPPPLPIHETTMQDPPGINRTPTGQRGWGPYTQDERPPPPMEGSQPVYRARAGDTLVNIARNLGITPNRLVAINQMALPYAFTEGQIFRGEPGSYRVATTANRPAETTNNIKPLWPATAAPPERTLRVTVQEGDTLTGIARRHHVRIGPLIEANQLRPPYRIQTGDQLVIPVSQ